MQYRLGYQIQSMLMSILIPRYHNKLNNIDFFKLATVAELDKVVAQIGIFFHSDFLKKCFLKCMKMTKI